MRATPPPNPPPCTPKGVGVQRPRRARPRDRGGDRQRPLVQVRAEISEPDLSPKNICVVSGEASVFQDEKKKREKKAAHKEKERRQQPTQDRPVVWRRGRPGIDSNAGSAVSLSR